MLEKSSVLVFTCREIESDVNKAENNEGEGHEDGGRNTEHKPAIIALPDALQQTKKPVLNGLVIFYFNVISKSDKIYAFYYFRPLVTRAKVLVICCFQELCCYCKLACIS